MRKTSLLITVAFTSFSIIGFQPQQCRADCNPDEVIRILDALAIVRIILGEIPGCPEPPVMCKPEFTPGVIDFLKSLSSYLSAEDFDRFMAMVKEVQVPEAFSLGQNYPNPFNPTTTIRFTIPEGGGLTTDHSPLTTLKIFNLLGQEVRVLVDEVKEPGHYTVMWDGRDASGQVVSSGVYFYRLTTEEFTSTKRMILMR